MKTVTYDENEWQLVPKISTIKMDGAGEDAYKDNGHCDCGNYDGCSMEEVYSAMLAVAPAAQESAPAELPSFVAGQTYESSEYGPLVFERLDTYYGETTYQFFWPAERRKRWIKPDDMRRHFCAAAYPQPVAKVLSEADIHAIIDSLPESAFEPTIAIGEITALFDDDNGEDEEVLEAIKAYAKIVAFRAIAASTPTTLTEKKE